MSITKSESSESTPRILRVSTDPFGFPNETFIVYEGKICTMDYATIINTVNPKARSNLDISYSPERRNNHV